MKRSTHLASAALAAVLTAGVTGPAVAANQQSVARDHGTVHAAAAKAKAAGKEKSKTKKQGADRRPGKPRAEDRAQDKVRRAADRQVQQALLAVTQVDKQLTKVVAQVRTAKLDSEDRTTLLANVAADRTMLAGLTASLKAGATSAETVRVSVKELRPQNYAQVIGHYRTISQLLDAIGELWLETEEGSSEEAALDEAELVVYEAYGLTDLVTARTAVAELQAITSRLSAARATVDAVSATLAADADGTTDTGV